jgi:hypothetical protein
MQQLRLPTVTPRLFSMATTDGVLVQIVSTSRRIVLDIQAENTATEGSPHDLYKTAR